MSVFIDPSKTLIHLYNHDVSYLMKVNSHRIVEHLYFGKRLKDIHEANQTGSENFQFYENGEFVNRDNYYENISRNEFGTYLRMDLRPASFIIEKEGDSLTDFRFVSLSRTKHNEYPDDYPHTKNKEKATSITLKLKDARRNIYLYATYTLFNEINILVKSTRIENKERKAILLRKIVSSTLDFDYEEQKLIHFPGHWAKERQYEEETLKHGERAFFSLEGRSGHFENPFFILANKEANEYEGEAYSFNLLYSGNFKNDIYVSSYDKLRVNVGINDTNFSFCLKRGESFLAPEVVIDYSMNGYNDLSLQNHRFIEEHILPSEWRKPFPLLFNSWEGTGMDFDMDKIKNYAKVARDIGSELFVLDDGWFSSRNDDKHGLGDWRINRKKVDLVALSKYVHSLGMKFGIWIEPEMVNIDTPLFKDHPEYVLSEEGLEYRFSRNQLVLDFSNPAVVDAVFHSIESSLKDVQFEYVKYDMNRYLGDIASRYSRQGEIYHRYVLGVYSFMARLKERFPSILFENCASGGGRFDLGMLYFSPLIWTSDNTDPLDRTLIQYGTSYAYPLSVISSHVSAAKGEYLNKANVAFMGSYGYEMNPLSLKEEEKKLLLGYNDLFHKYHEKVIQKGTLYRLMNPFVSGIMAEMSVSKGRNESFLLLSLVKDIDIPIHLILKGLDPKKTYRVLDKTYQGKELLQKGIDIPNISKKGDTVLLPILSEESL